MNDQPALFADDSLIQEQKCLLQARRANEAHVRKIQKDALKSDTRVGPWVRAYTNHFRQPFSNPRDLLNDLTRWLIDARDETEALIRAEMSARHSANPERIAGSIANSLKRSAGTNYQSLVSYALARYLLQSGSAWYLERPVPKAFREALAITFSAGIPRQEEEQTVASHDRAGEERRSIEDVVAETLDSERDEETETRVQPDVDVLLRNACWQGDSDEPEPVVLLSVKTSLVDRGGQAARWKLYFDLVTKPCPHRNLHDCAYDQLGISMENTNRYRITHGIVTANIYKYRFQDARYHGGELNSGQTRSNTFMFDLRLTTRNDSTATPAPGWQPFMSIADVLSNISAEYHLPE